MFARGGVEALKELRWDRTISDLDAFRGTLEDYFRKNPPTTSAEAGEIIKKLTGIERSPTQVREFLHRIGMKLRKVATIAAKADPDKQEDFKKKNSNLDLKKRRPEPEESTSWTDPTSSWEPSLGGSGVLHAFLSEAHQAGNGSMF
jgi:hypothetical protein